MGERWEQDGSVKSDDESSGPCNFDKVHGSVERNQSVVERKGGMLSLLTGQLEQKHFDGLPGFDSSILQ